MRKNLHKLISSQFSPKIRICFRCNMKHLEECFITYPNTPKCVKKTRFFNTLLGVWICDETLFIVFHILHKLFTYSASFSCPHLFLFIPIITTNFIRPKGIIYHSCCSIISEPTANTDIILFTIYERIFEKITHWTRRVIQTW